MQGKVKSVVWWRRALGGDLREQRTRERLFNSAAQIIEEKDLLAVCRKTFTHSDMLVCYAKWKERLVGKSASTFIFK